ncbi:hypothetical protein H2198_002905 [Neophaeococcomyces mojaviensis]|uniref:Uncharacterized protein n=1 Tax=Neophaeococcomyces mojaviensis TaxID=3383035 RepID=A0ACC3ADB7_9EURO|nr:hypothetical protein H2198_002905 [Knufia sp. JES_112]
MDKVTATMFYYALSKEERAVAWRKTMEEQHGVHSVHVFKQILTELQMEINIGLRNKDITTVYAKLYNYIKQNDGGGTISYWRGTYGSSVIDSVIQIIGEVEMQSTAQMAPTFDELSRLSKPAPDTLAIQSTQTEKTNEALNIMQKEIKTIRESQEQMSQAISNLNTIIETCRKDNESLRTSQKRLQEQYQI